MFKIWTSYDEKVDHDVKELGDVGFTVSFFPENGLEFFLHVCGYANPSAGG